MCCDAAFMCYLQNGSGKGKFLWQKKNEGRKVGSLGVLYFCAKCTRHEIKYTFEKKWKDIILYSGNYF